jgi:hypothetical protein
MATVTIIPGFIRLSISSTEMRTGIRCVTFTNWPEGLAEGIRENCDVVAEPMMVTFPLNVFPG